MYTKKQKVEIHIIFLLIVLSVELFSILLSKKGILQLYKTNQHLPWVLPVQWLFPIWTLLYILLAWTGALIWTKRASHIRSFALRAWVLQIVLNTLWPICFFYLPIPVLTPILITILFMTLLVLMFYTFLITRLGAYLLIPYFLMVVYKLLFHWVFFILNINLL
ncbi:MAG: TspO/MBR family protein [Simkaniaceae bacterium]